MKEPKCTKLPLPGEIYTVVWEADPNYRRLVKVVSYAPEQSQYCDSGCSTFDYEEMCTPWLFKSQSLEGNGKGTVSYSVHVHNPEDKCLVWHRLKEPTEEDLKRRTVFE